MNEEIKEVRGGSRMNEEEAETDIKKECGGSRIKRVACT